jgi:GNAT superfamily N-acetyltransferase
MAWLAVLERVPEPARPRRVGGDLQSVYVLPEWRGRGVGGLLIQAVIAAAGAADTEHLTVRSGRLSVPLHRRHGFGNAERSLEMGGQ